MNILFAFTLFILSFSVHAKVQEITVVTYYNYLPWMDKKEDVGLNSDLCKELTKLSKGKYKFIPMHMPRARLNVHLKGNDKILVAWVTPFFFEDEKKEKYLWSHVLGHDVAYFISAKNRKFEYKDESSFKGKRFSAVLGHIYPDLDPYFKNGELIREDASGLTFALKKLLLKERFLDFADINRSSLYAMERKKIINKSDFYLSPKPRIKNIERSILVSKSLKSIINPLNQYIDELNKDPNWIKHLNENGITLQETP